MDSHESACKSHIIIDLSIRINGTLRMAVLWALEDVHHTSGADTVGRGLHGWQTHSCHERRGARRGLLALCQAEAESQCQTFAEAWCRRTSGRMEGWLGQFDFEVVWRTCHLWESLSGREGPEH